MIILGANVEPHLQDLHLEVVRAQEDQVGQDPGQAQTSAERADDFSHGKITGEVEDKNRTQNNMCILFSQLA